MILIGPPGAGKGTQANRLEEALSIGNLSTGALLRDAITSDSELGKEAKVLVEGGNFVPDDIIIALVSARIDEPDCAEGFILDGFPRTLPQAKALDKILEARESKVDAVIEFELDDEIVVERITGRFSCKKCHEGYHKAHKLPAVEGVCDSCGGTEFVQRADDSEEKIRTRLALYHEQTEPLIDYYSKQNINKEINAQGSIEEIKNTILNSITK